MPWSLTLGAAWAQEVDELEVIYNKCIHGEVAIPGRDFCDMSQGYNVPFEQWRLVNAMLPRVYYPPLKDNVYERRCADIVRQLFDSNNFGIDCTPPMACPDGNRVASRPVWPPQMTSSSPRSHSVMRRCLRGIKTSRTWFGAGVPCGPGPGHRVCDQAASASAQVLARDG